LIEELEVFDDSTELSDDDAAEEDELVTVALDWCGFLVL